MAQHNIVYLYGVADSTPLISRKEDGRVTARFSLLTCASGMRSFDGGKRWQDDTLCQVQIMTGRKDIAETISRIRMCDIVLLKGTFNTRDLPKGITCENCGEEIPLKKRTMEEENSEEQSQGKKEKAPSIMVTFVSPIAIDIINEEFGNRIAPVIKRLQDGVFDETGKENEEEEMRLDDERAKIQNEAAGFILESGRREFSNYVMLIGNLCADPVQWKDGDAPACSYQLGVNRKLFLKDDSPATRSDYPFIRSYGVQADNDLQALQKGSLVMVEGFIKRRFFYRTSVCPHCGKEMKWKSSVYEIVPYAVEYMADYKSGEERKAEGA